MLFRTVFATTLAIAHIGFSSDEPVHEYTYEIVNVYPHDPKAFTQGLIYRNGVFYESTGLRGRSSLRRVEVQTGRIIDSHPLLPLYFGEGLTIKNNLAYQLTWTSGVGFIYDITSMKLVREFRYGIEGWGLTDDGEELIVSDGSANLYFWDSKTLLETNRITVNDRGREVDKLNELEFIEGEIFANIWMSDKIARIAPTTGKVLGWIDLSGLLDESNRTGNEDVLNGIAYDSQSGRLFVTGKLWPKLFEITLRKKNRY